MQFQLKIVRSHIRKNKQYNASCFHQYSFQSSWEIVIRINALPFSHIIDGDGNENECRWWHNARISPPFSIRGDRPIAPSGLSMSMWVLAFYLTAPRQLDRFDEFLHSTCIFFHSFTLNQHTTSRQWLEILPRGRGRGATRGTGTELDYCNVLLV